MNPTSSPPYFSPLSFYYAQYDGVNDKWMCIKKFRKPYASKAADELPPLDPELPREFRLAQLEFEHLKRLARLGIACPEPIDQKDCLVLMEMIGDGDGPAPTLKEALGAFPEIWEDTLVQCVRLLRDLYMRGGLVHGNVSEKKLLFGRRID